MAGLLAMASKRVVCSLSVPTTESDSQRERVAEGERESDGGRETSNKWLSGLNSVLVDWEVSVDWVDRYTSCASFSPLSIPLAGPSPRVLK